ncbi:MAG: 4Fe-4S dicluster domain-containing protein [Firmicutes bacterium]|nr:4Fe-4S dicluster domain-containing protein [Bacillota bacterium]
MPKVTFREDRCKGCELCISVCPRNILVMSEKMNQKGFHYATITDQSRCIACAFCARMCPDTVIEVER